MENLARLWEKFSLSEEEGSLYKSEALEGGSRHVIATKFFTHRALNMEAIARTFKPLWQTKLGFEVKDVGNHTVHFVFGDEVEADRVLMGELWNYDKHLVSLRRLVSNVPVKDLEFNLTLFWVQLHDLPLGDMNPRSVCEIAKIIEEYNLGGLSGVLRMVVVTCASRCGLTH